jgi:hypothetical protein
MVRPFIALEAGADERQVLGAGHVVDGRPVQNTARQLLLVQLDQLSGLQCLGGETLLLFLRAVTPVDVVRLAHGRPAFDPLLNMRVFDHRAGVLAFAAAVVND